MAVVTEGSRSFSGGYPPESMSYEFGYNFAVTGGATADTYQLGLADKKFLVTKYEVRVKTAFTSGGAAVVTLGTGSDADAFIDAAAGPVAGLTADAVISDQAAGTNLVLASGETLSLAIATADLTAGSLSLYIEGYSLD